MTIISKYKDQDYIFARKKKSWAVLLSEVEVGLKVAHKSSFWAIPLSEVEVGSNIEHKSNLITLLSICSSWIERLGPNVNVGPSSSHI